MSNETQTLAGPPRARSGHAPPRLTLTVLWHADVSRVGERVQLEPGVRQAVSRKEPHFASPDGRGGGPLDDPYVSRRTA